MIDVKILEAAKQEVADTLFLKSEKLKSLPLQEQYEFDIDITKLPPPSDQCKAWQQVLLRRTQNYGFGADTK
jgi:hypothetical protein